MTATLEPGVRFDSGFLPSQELDIGTKLRTTLLLGIVSLAAFQAQKHGLTLHLPPGIEQVAESCAHPVLGYGGAWAGTEIAALVHRPNKARDLAFAAATTANFVTETAQDLWNSQVLTWQYHGLETAKDYLFALGGMLWFFRQSRKRPL